MPTARVNLEEETTQEGDGGREVMRRGEEKREEGLGYGKGVSQVSKLRGEDISLRGSGLRGVVRWAGP